MRWGNIQQPKLGLPITSNIQHSNKNSEDEDEHDDEDD
jgi:hypothetical protein